MRPARRSAQSVIFTPGTPRHNHRRALPAATGAIRSPRVSSEVRNLFGSATGAIMADKSPRQAASKKSGKSIKEKRADKRAASAPASSLDVTSKAAKKK
ncbi:MAG: hypothetical protein NVSMB43_25740 [Pseudarthrobacter sp.]